MQALQLENQILWMNMHICGYFVCGIQLIKIRAIQSINSTACGFVMFQNTQWMRAQNIFLGVQ